MDFGVEILVKSRSKFDNMLLCKKHRNEIKNNNYIRDERPPKRPMALRVCDVCGASGIDGDVFLKNGEYLCRKHYNHVYLYGEVLERTVFDKNEIVVKEDYTEVVLYNSKHEEVGRAVIDIDDIEIASDYKWRFDTAHGYAATSIKGTYLAMHQLIMNTKKLGISVVVDHIDRDKLNNRKDNLRVTNKSTNAINVDLRVNNKSGVTGVSFSRRHNLWRSYISYDGKRMDLGWHKDKEDAIRSRLNAEARYYPDYPPQEHLFEKYNIEKSEVIE